MELLVEVSGCVRCVYGEEVDLRVLGSLTVRRASHVEPDAFGRWVSDLSPVSGPCLGPFSSRSDALRAEIAWLSANWLTAAQS